MPQSVPQFASPARREQPAGRPDWNALIDDIVAGRWVDPETAKPAKVPFESIVIADSLEGQEAELVGALKLGSRFTVVADEATYGAMGGRVRRALERLGPADEIVLDHPHADMTHVAALRERLKGAEAVIAVGSGTVNDLCKYATFLDGRRYAVFGTGASMNGYTSSTASITLDSGLKVSLPAQAPAGCFIDLGVSAAAPKRLAAAGFADCLVRSVAQVDWWMSHRLWGSLYTTVPFLLQEADERELNARAALLPAGDLDAMGYLYRVLTLCGLGIAFTGMSNHGSMGEHQISHYIDCFAGERHPGSLHGEQVGVAVLTMGRLQQRMLASDAPPVLEPTRIDRADMARRMGAEVAEQCWREIQPKLLDEAGSARVNAKLSEIWPALRRETAPFIVPVAEMERLLKAAGAATTAEELGVPVDFYREAVVHCREMRNRYSFLDLAADSGTLEDFARGER